MDPNELILRMETFVKAKHEADRVREEGLMDPGTGLYNVRGLLRRATELSADADVLLHMCHFVNGVVTDRRLTSCCSGHLDAARTAREAKVRTLVLVHITEQIERPGIRERVLHEAAHLRRRHVPIRMLSILPACGAGALVTKALGEQPWSVAAGSVVGILMTMLILRIVAYRTEFDADVQACRLAVTISGNSSCRSSRVCRRTFSCASRRFSWARRTSISSSATRQGFVT